MGDDILEGLVEPFDLVVTGAFWGRESTLDLEILGEVAISEPAQCILPLACFNSHCFLFLFLNP